RVHGLLPHRRANEQRRGGHGHCRGPRRAEPDGGGTAQIAGVCGVSGTFLELNRGAIVKRRYRRGEVICREGEFGSTAFYILEGNAQVAIATPIAHVKTQGGTQGFFKRLTSVLVGREQDKREEEARDRSIPIDASVDLSYGNPVAELGPGDLFGEMTCMNFYPR